VLVDSKCVMVAFQDELQHKSSTASLMSTASTTTSSATLSSTTNNTSNNNAMTAVGAELVPPNVDLVAQPVSTPMQCCLFVVIL
jgi:hypothetical protein